MNLNHRRTRRNLRLWLPMLAAALFALSANDGFADLITLTSGNSVAKLRTRSTDPGSPAGLYSWTVNGVEQVKQQWYWFRVGAAGGETSVDTLPYSVVGTPPVVGVDTASLEYQGAGFRIRVNYSLMAGGSPASASDMTHDIHVFNDSGSSLVFHLFEYSDYDLGGSAAGDTLTFPNGNAVSQSDGYSLSQITTGTSLRQAVNDGSILTSLNDGSPTTLNNLPALNSPLSGADISFAYEWDQTIPAGGDYDIGFPDSHISTPEPASLALLSLGGLMLARMARRIR